MPRVKSKATKIAYTILGRPLPLQYEKKKQKKLEKTLTMYETKKER